MDPDEVHPVVVRQLAEVIAVLLSIILWRTGEVFEDWKKSSVILIFIKTQVGKSRKLHTS